MNIKIEYESETLLPPEIFEKFNDCKRWILRDHLEYDKIICHIDRLCGEIIRWLSENRKYEEV